MGFITSATTEYLDVHLSGEGRKNLLLSGGTIFKFFGLGDSDIDYLNKTTRTSGNLPDVTGDHTDCIYSMANSVSINYPIPFGEIDNDTTQQTFDSDVVLFFNDCNKLVYWNSAEVDIYLHDYFVLFKQLANLKIGSTSNLTSNTWWGNRSLASFANNKPTYITEEDLYFSLEKIARGVFLDYFDYVKVKKGANFYDGNFEVVLDQLNSEIFTELTQAIFNFENGLDNYDIDGSVIDLSGKTSPFTLTHSSLKTPFGEYRGAGPAGISVYPFDYGYIAVNKDVLIANNVNYNIYPKYVISPGTDKGFYNAYSLEKAGENLVVDFVKPSSRILLADGSSFYYPLSNNILNSTTTLNNNTNSLTKTATALETYTLFGTQVEYTFTNTKLEPSLDNLTTSGEPIFLFSRMISLTENFIDSFVKKSKYNQPKLGVVVDETNFKKITFNIVIQEPTLVRTRPANLKVNIILSKVALSQSLPININNNIRKLFDDTTIKYFGENYLATPSSGFTSDPLDFNFIANNTTYNTFRKIKGLR